MWGGGWEKKIKNKKRGAIVTRIRNGSLRM